MDNEVLAIAFYIQDAKRIIAFPEVYKHFSGPAKVTPLFVKDEEDPYPLCFMLDSEDYTKIIFLGGRWREWVDNSGELHGEWTSDWEGKWWFE